jgi:hypothetical protein
MRNFYGGTGGLFLVYPVICLVLYILFTSTPSTTEFMGQEVSNGFAHWLANTAYSNLVNAKAVVVCLLASAALFTAMKKSK